MEHEPKPRSSQNRNAQIEVVVKECLQQWLRGEAVDEVEIVDEHPGLAPELAVEIRKARMVAKALGGQAPGPADTLAEPTLRVRCPHCRHPTEVLDTQSDSFQCNSCGGEILLASEPDEEQRLTGHRLGNFRLESLLGTGAFGAVWRAHDEELDRVVAVKIPRRSQFEPTQADQFFREARIAAQLDHPQIVRVHEVGKDKDTVFIVSDFVNGLPLSQWCKGRAISFQEATEICATIAEALQHAHELGVVHRDLKPANVMMDHRNLPRIMDFGLAKRDAGEMTMTADGQVLGTPAYMSPEQALGDSHRVDGRSDIYSLGVILFELLTGELPFRGSVRMLIDQVIHEEPPRPRRLVGNLPFDLETICLKCLAKDRGGRYASAQELADDLRRFLRGEPIKARPISSIHRAWRWCQRNPMAATVFALTTFAAVAGPAYAWQEHHQRVLIETQNDQYARLIVRMKRDEVAYTRRLGMVTSSFGTAEDTNAARGHLAWIAAEKYAGTKAENPSVKYLLGVGIILAERGQIADAIANLEAARQGLDERLAVESRRELQLAHADCCWRLSRLYLAVPDAAKSTERARQAKTTLVRVTQERPSAIALAQLDRLNTYMMAFGAASSTLDEIDYSSIDPVTLKALLPEDPQGIYEFAHGFFTLTPPLLPADVH